jgi:hypothetical protein
MPPHYAALLNGKYSICWQCGGRMILHPGNLEMDRPICDKCRLGISDEEELPLTDRMKEFLEKKVG